MSFVVTIINLHFVISGYISGIEKVWIVGDEFTFRTYDEYFEQRNHKEYNGFTKENYEIHGVTTSKYASVDKNIVSRIRNKFAKAIEEKKFLPKLVVIIPDDDLIRGIQTNKEFEDTVWARLVLWVMREMKKLVEIQKDFLPNKAKRAGEPKMIWVELPLNVDFTNNQDRIKFTKIIKEAASQLDGVSVLKLKQIWECDCHNYFIRNALHYTFEGLKKYWEAVDRTIRYAITSRDNKNIIANKSKVARHSHNPFVWTRIGEATRNQQKNLQNNAIPQCHPKARKQLCYEDL